MCLNQRNVADIIQDGDLTVDGRQPRACMYNLILGGDLPFDLGEFHVEYYMGS